jgi:DNA-binding NtrC family response regulator
MNKNILIIEPDQQEHAIFSKLLSDRYDITFAYDVNAALNLLAKKTFGVVVFGMGQAKNDVIVALKNLKSHVENKPFIIAITSFNTLEIEKTVASIGVFYHLLKPYNVKDLDDLIGAAIVRCEKDNR